MAAMTAVNPRVNFAELQQWPDTECRYELYDGEIVVVPAPFPRHQRVAQHITEVLTDYERAVGGLVFESPLDIVLSEYDVVQPDVVFFGKERRHLIDMMQATRVVPDLAVEVVSPSTEAQDRGRKLQLLARFGVPEYWIVDPLANTLEIYTNVGERYFLARTYDDRHEVSSPTLPGLCFAASRIFAE